jgi:eukaryotic-like serine/threonine-protein kinase
MKREPRAHVVNRYETYGEVASGGMATVEYGRLIGPHNFTRPVAIKRLHAHFAKDPAFAAMFLDEARLSARLIHANIIPTIDVIEHPGEIALVMEYVHGEALSNLLQLASTRGELVPVKVATALIASVLHGLHAAHEARDERDQLLRVVHRDVSPHNVLVGADGIPRLLDFGIAKAVDHLRTTPSGEIKGKLAYIAPEQLTGQPVDRRADVFGAAAVLWETLTGFMLFQADNATVLVQRVLDEPIKPPSVHRPDLPPALDAVVMRGLERDRDQRYASAREMALELERRVGIATQSEVSDWLQHLAAEELNARAHKLRKLQERGGVPLRGPALHKDPARSTRPIATEIDTTLPGSTPPSIETQSHATEVRSVWPWFAGGLTLLIMLALGLTQWLRGGASERPPPHAVAPLVVPATPPSAMVREAPEPEPAAPEVVPVAVPEAPPEEEPKPAASPVRSSKRASAKPQARVAAPEVKATPIAEPKCSPVIYVDGIRRINPDCPPHKAKIQPAVP